MTSIFIQKGFARGGNGDVTCDTYHKYKVQKTQGFYLSNFVW